MNNNKFKIIHIALCCFFMGLWSVSQGMEDRLDNEEFVSPKVSWGAYLMSPLKQTLQTANSIMTYGINNPKKSILIGLHMTCNTVLASLEYYDCLCKMRINKKSSFVKEAAFMFTTNYTNIAVCERECHLLCLETTVLSGNLVMNPNTSECFVGLIVF